MVSNSELKTSKIGVLLVGHGSRLPYGKEVVTNLAQMYRENEDYLVEVGFMEMTKPTIPSAINKLAKNGVEKIIVTPVFLAHGVHTKHDIPHILGLDNGHEHSHKHSHRHDEEEEEIEFGGEIIYTEPLGSDPRIVDIIKDRVNKSL
ncbi:MAG: sirohydrochlorin nickelochelatase [Methanobacterium sp. BRmetb2]|nr:MAG: sirohydrochlorin nickelochelatase [Methanobacterium sp. BRmetb2]